jgi:hypothetical protein
LGGIKKKALAIGASIPVLGKLAGIITGISVSISGLIALLPVILGLLAVLAALGGVLVGVLSNTDKIISGISTTMDLLRTATEGVGEALLTFFVDVWNAIVDVLEGVAAIILPIVKLFGVLDGEGSSLGATLGALGNVVNATIGALGATIKLIGAILRGIGIAIGAVISGVIRLASNLNIFDGPVTGGLTFVDVLQGIADLLTTLENKLRSAVKIISKSFTKIAKDITKEINNIIKAINKLIRAQNEDVRFGPNDNLTFRNVPGVGENAIIQEEIELIERPEEPDFSSVDANKEDAATGAGVLEGMLGSKNNKINYNEDNSTNIDQTIDADPEDQAQLSRVVTDAINEANSFERRLQGGQ